MKYNPAQLNENLKRGVTTLAEQGFLKLGEDGVLIKALKGDCVKVEKASSVIVITYDTESHFYMALGRVIGMKDGTWWIPTKVSRMGIMLDCSRNAVAHPTMVKRLISMLVLLGYNYLELYTEETYELPDEPYFGYKRGRYSREELTELVEFSEIFQFELVPCIQTLAHLRNLANWMVYFDHIDKEDVLLVGDERTYRLIRKCVRFCKEVFRTKRINIGADEAAHLGEDKGKYVKLHGQRPKSEIFLEHIKKVFDICEEEGMEPEIWADEFCRMKMSNEDIGKIFNGKQTIIYHDYEVRNVEEHSQKIKKLESYSGKVSFAGGLRTWNSFAPDNHFTERTIGPAFAAVEACGVDDILMTSWGDGGAECSVYAVIPSIWTATAHIYPCDVDADKIVKTITGYTLNEWRECDSLNHVVPRTGTICNAVKYMLYNDFLIGLLDYHIPEFAGDVYRELYEKFRLYAERESQFAYIFEAYAAMCKVLIRKATYSKRLYQAYQKKDIPIMRKLVEELKAIREDMQEFHSAFRCYWMAENKGFGFEISDIRIGGIIPRIDTVVAMLEDYLDGKTEKIYELEEERLPYWCDRFLDEDKYAVLHDDWWTAYTVNHLKMFW